MPTKMNARALITDLLFAEPSAQINTRHFLLASQLFGISDNSTRVALTRLSADGVIESVERGVYRLTDQAKEISKPVANRLGGLNTTREWTGQYLAVHTGGLGRVDRSALNRRERTLHLNGFRELQSDLFIRPDNLEESFDDTLQRLIETGVDASVPMFIIGQFNKSTNKQISKLWDGKALNQRYQKTSQQIQKWLVGFEDLALDVAARESLLIGRQAIPLLMTDPLLPEPFINTVARQQFANDVRSLDQAGYQLWQQFFQSASSLQENTI